MSRVFFIGWQGADSGFVQSLLSSQRLPYLASLVERGAQMELVVPRPAHSHAAWTSLATGMRPHEHGILHTHVPAADGQRVAPVTIRDRLQPALWNILNASGKRTHVVGWPVTSPAERIIGVCVSDQLGSLRSGAFDAAGATTWAEPQDVQGVLRSQFVSPGQLDEITVGQMIPRSVQGLQVLSHLTTACRSILAETATYFRILRWCLRECPWDFAGCVFPALRRAHELAHWLQQTVPGTADQANEIVAGCYEHHDLLLGQLLSQIGDVNVLAVALSAGNADGAQARGIAALAGPTIRHGAAATRRTVLDVTPTVLTLLGVPLSPNLTGRPWSDLIENDVVCQSEPLTVRMPTAAKVLVDEFAQSSDFEPNAADNDTAVAHLVELGYTDPYAANAQEKVRRCRWTILMRKALSELDAGLIADAMIRLEQCVSEDPESHPARVLLAEVYLRANKRRAARQQIEWLRYHGNEQPQVYRLAAATELADRNFAAALTELEGTRRGEIRLAGADAMAGCVWLRRHEVERARDAFHAAIEVCGPTSDALTGLAATELVSGNPESAAMHALDALAIDMQLARAHYYLGVAIAQLDRPHEALQAFETWAKLEPAAAAPYRWMAHICDRQLHDSARATEFRRQARSIVRQRRTLSRR